MTCRTERMGILWLNFLAVYKLLRDTGNVSTFHHVATVFISKSFISSLLHLFLLSSPGLRNFTHSIPLCWASHTSKWLPSGLQGWPCPVYPEKLPQINMCRNVFLFYTIELVWICNYLLECFLVNLLFPSLNSKFHEPKNRISLFDKPPYLYPAHTSGKE